VKNRKQFRTLEHPVFCTPAHLPSVTQILRMTPTPLSVVDATLEQLKPCSIRFHSRTLPLRDFTNRKIEFRFGSVPLCVVFHSL